MDRRRDILDGVRGREIVDVGHVNNRLFDRRVGNVPRVFGRRRYRGRAGTRAADENIFDRVSFLLRISVAERIIRTESFDGFGKEALES